VFDWNDVSTHPNPFNAVGKIDAVYLVFEALNDALQVVKPFIDLAKEKGVKRFVLLSASAIERGGPTLGQVHEYIANLGVEYTVLRPSWFFGAFQATRQLPIDQDRFLYRKLPQRY
jgi:festuclavine dehydrogenase